MKNRKRSRKFLRFFCISIIPRWSFLSWRKMGLWVCRGRSQEFCVWGACGWLSQLNDWLLTSAQVMVLRLQDTALHQALCWMWNLFEIFSLLLSLLFPHLIFSLLKKKKNSVFDMLNLRHKLTMTLKISSRQLSRQLNRTGREHHQPMAEQLKDGRPWGGLEKRAV